ncbi:hypothetical protein EON65_19880 [archaeon]|nr:MAG: hypothetical protein EON65_19880 [archaeon]
MPTRSNSNLQFIDQGNFVLWEEQFDEDYVPSNKSLLVTSQTNGLIFAAHNGDVKVISFTKLESHFAGDEEVSLPDEACLSTLIFSDNVRMLTLSPDESMLAIMTEKHVFIFYSDSFSDQVFIFLLHIFGTVLFTFLPLLEYYNWQGYFSNHSVSIGQDLSCALDHEYRAVLFWGGQF